MRICLATDTFIPEVNGVTTVLATMRRELTRRGHDVLVLAPRYPDQSEPEPDVIRLGSMPCTGYRQVHLSWPWGRGLYRRLDQFEPHIVQAVTEGPLGWFGRNYAVRRRLPLATSFHTDFPRYARAHLGEWAVRPTQWWLKRCHSRAALTMTPSASTRKELSSLGVPAPVVWGRGVDTGWFHPGRRSITRTEADRLLAELRTVLEQGIANGGTTLRDYRTPDGESGRNQLELGAYGRAGQPCLRCGTELKRTVIDARGTTHCPRCQCRR